MITVELTNEQVAYARAVAWARNAAARRFGRSDRTVKGDGTLNDTVGAVAEVAVCCAYGLDPLVWVTAQRLNDTFRQADVAGIDVRATTRSTGRLLLHHDDASERAHLLVIVNPVDVRRCILAGWVWGYEGQDPRFWDLSMPRPCYAVPVGFLRDPAELPLDVEVGEA